MARIHHQGVQQSLLHQTTATPPTECTERTEPSCRERTPTDGTDEHRWLGCAVLPQNLAAWVWQGCHTLLICEHPCSSVGDSSLPEGSVCAFCGNIFSPTDGTDEHRWLWCVVLPQNSQNTQNLAAWVWQGCHTHLICEHPCSSVGGSSLPEGSVRSVRSVGEHRSLVGAAETAAPTE